MTNNSNEEDTAAETIEVPNLSSEQTAQNISHYQYMAMHILHLPFEQAI